MGADGAEPRPLERIGILGAGTMGAGIAQIAAEAGIEAVVHDPIAGAYERAQERIAGFLARKVEKGQLEAAAAAAALDRHQLRTVVRGARGRRTSWWRRSPRSSS